LGIIVFLLPAIFKFNVAQMAVFIATVLFLMSPVITLVNIVPTYTIIKVSLERIEEINKLLKTDAAAEIHSGKHPGQFNVIRFQDITYRYSDDNDTAFTFSLPDFSIYKDEILMVVGGNGSGKTTFINILTGLFKPQSGRVFIDEKELSWREFCDFSNNMAVIFSDHYLFRTNYDKHDLSENNPRLKYFRDLINLNDILKVDARYNQFDTDLSKGQQKRVALLAALLEDKPIIVLDEWAAEQDPYNKNCFYTKWLETIRNMGKTVIVVSHDDSYYHMATRLVKFEFGNITSDNTRVTGIVN
jgi:ABC-type siderophore export system fused ATPase/permease subunit